MHSSLVLLCLFIVSTAFISAEAQNASCHEIQNCPECHPWYRKICVDFLSYLGDHSDFKTNMDTAMDIMLKYGKVNSDDRYFVHTTLQYVCCYGPIDIVKIYEFLNDYKWEPFNMTFTQVVCNKGSDGLSVIIYADEESQRVAGKYVADLERALNASGVPVHVPRSVQQPFHSTVGVVGEDYPLEKAMAEISAKIKVFNPTPILITNFIAFAPPGEWFANGYGPKSKLT